MLFLPSARTCEVGLPSEARIPGFRDSAFAVISGTGTDTICSPYPSMGQGNQYQSRVLHKRLLLYKQAREARVWAEVEDRAHGSRLQGPRGVSTPSHHRLSQLISR